MGAAFAPAIAACGGGSGGGSGAKGSKKITVWWNSGYYASEDQAIKKLVSDWEKKTGNSVDLQFYSTVTLPTKEQSAVTSGVLPDVVVAQKGNTSTYAYQGKLADMSDVVNSTPLTKGALRSVYLHNSKTGKSSYYAVPVNQFSVSLFYWHDMLLKSGMNPASMPNDWQGFWKFWENAQGAYRKKTGQKVYGIGWPMSTGAGDTNYDTQMIMMAYGAQLLDHEGKLQATQASVKDAMVKAITWITDLYKNKYSPPGCVNWNDASNNTFFLNRSILITPNGSLSIPGAVKGKKQQEWKNIVTLPFPDKPSGGPVPSIADVHNAVVFENSPNKELAKDFLRFFIKPENTAQWLKAGHARWFPVQTSLLQDPFFAKSSDPNVQVVAKQLAGNTEPAWVNISVAYNHAALQDLWGNALGRVVVQNQSPKDAATYAVTQLTQAFSQYKG